MDFSNEKFLEITKSLNDRDISLYENIFLNDEDEDLEIEPNDMNNKTNLISNQLNVINNLSACNDSHLSNLKNVCNNESVQTETKLNVLNTLLCETRINNNNNNKDYDLIDNQGNLSNKKVVNIEENICTKETNDSVSINLVNKDNIQDLCSMSFGNETILPNTETSIDSSNEKLLESNNFEKSFENNQSLINDSETINDKEIIFKNTEINISSTVAQPSKTVDKNISVKESSIISKLQNMNWLKSRTPNDIVNTNSSAKPTLKSIYKKDEQNKDILRFDNLNNKKCKLYDSTQNKNENEMSNFAKLNNNDGQKNLHQPNVKGTWGNANTAKELFPNAKSLVIDSSRETEELNLAIAESICTAEQENERRKMFGRNLKYNFDDDSDDNDREKIHQNLPSDLSTDYPQNQAKGFVDKYGRVDGYSEKRLFIGKGARKKEQELIKAHTENKPRMQNSQGFLQPQSSMRKLPFEPNERKEDNENKKSQLLNPRERVLQNKGQDKSMCGRPAAKDLESDYSINVSDRKLESNHDFVNKNQEMKGWVQSHFYQSQNVPAKCQEYKKNQDHGVKHYNYYDRQQEHFINSQPSYPDNAKKKQDFFNKGANYQDKSTDGSPIKYQENSNRSQEYFSRNKNYSSTHHESGSNSPRRFNRYAKDDYLDEQKKCNFTLQKHCENTNQQGYNSQWKPKRLVPEPKFPNNFEQNKHYNDHENKSRADNKADVNEKIDVKREKQSTNFNLSKQKPPASWTWPKNASDESIAPSTSDTRRINESVAQSADTERSLSRETSKRAAADGAQEGSSASCCDPKTNVVISFEGNQNVQRALGLNRKRDGAAEPAAKFDEQTMGEDSVGAGPSYPCVSQGMVSTACKSPVYEPMNPMNPMNPMMMPPFQATGNPAIPSTGGALLADPTEPLFAVLPEAKQQQQIRMNEISTSSQNLLSLHNTVCSLSKQLAAAQANLLAAQVKFYQNAVSCSTNSPNQLPMQSQNFLMPQTMPPPVNYSNHPVADSSYHANIRMEPIMNNQSMYVQQNPPYGQQDPNYLQYCVNAKRANAIPRGATLRRNGEDGEQPQGIGNQFYTH